MKATWNGAMIAESDNTVVVEGNHYFPRASLNDEYFSPNTKTSFCGWKGTANYLDVEVAGSRNEAAAWYYADPLPKATHIKDYVAFWNGVRVTE